MSLTVTLSNSASPGGRADLKPFRARRTSKAVTTSTLCYAGRNDVRALESQVPGGRWIASKSKRNPPLSSSEQAAEESHGDVRRHRDGSQALPECRPSPSPCRASTPAPGKASARPPPNRQQC